MDDFIYKFIDYDLTTVKITDLNRDIFGWLELQDINVIIIIALIILVSGINMTSALMIMILERTGFIGLLKAMGATAVVSPQSAEVYSEQLEVIDDKQEE